MATLRALGERLARQQGALLPKPAHQACLWLRPESVAFSGMAVRALGSCRLPSFVLVLQ